MHTIYLQSIVLSRTPKSICVEKCPRNKKMIRSGAVTDVTRLIKRFLDIGSHSQCQRSLNNCERDLINELGNMNAR